MIKQRTAKLAFAIISSLILVVAQAVPTYAQADCAVTISNPNNISVGNGTQYFVVSFKNTGDTAFNDWYWQQSFQGTGEYQYQLNYDGSTISPAPTGGGGWYYQGTLNPGAEVTYKIYINPTSARNVALQAYWSSNYNACSVTGSPLVISEYVPPVPTPSAPVVTATTNGTSVELTWPAVENAVTYDVIKNGTTVSDNQTATLYQESGLALNTEYQFAVTATNTTGTSGTSNYIVYTPVPNDYVSPDPDIPAGYIKMVSLSIALFAGWLTIRAFRWKDSRD
jgi:hypothetical protein